MKIEIFGLGCQSCKRLFENTKLAVSEMKLNADVNYVSDMQKIMELGFSSSPILAIDGKPILVGSSPGKEKIKEIISDYI